MLAFQQQIPNLIETMAFWAFAQRVARLTIAIRVLKVNTVFHLNIAANTGRTPEFTGNFIYLEFRVQLQPFAAPRARRNAFQRRVQTVCMVRDVAFIAKQQIRLKCLKMAYENSS